MTKDEAIAQLDALDSGDVEADHSAADDILLEILRANGLEDVAAAWVAAYTRVGFWYA